MPTSKDEIQIWVKGDKKLRKLIRVKAAQLDIPMQDFVRLAIDSALKKDTRFFRNGGVCKRQLDTDDQP